MATAKTMTVVVNKAGTLATGAIPPGETLVMATLAPAAQARREMGVMVVTRWAAILVTGKAGTVGALLAVTAGTRVIVA